MEIHEEHIKCDISEIISIAAWITIPTDLKIPIDLEDKVTAYRADFAKSKVNNENDDEEQK